MKISLYVIIFYITAFALFLSYENYVDPYHVLNNVSVDSRTEELCRWYSSLDHEKEFSKERWEKNKDWIQKYDWYGSCINHVKHPVARK